MAEFSIIADIALYYEIVVFGFYLLLLRQVKKRYNEKRNEMTRLLLNIFIAYSFALFFSIISKAFNVLWGGVPYTLVAPFWVWPLGILHAGRLGFVGVIVGTIFTFQLFLVIFDKEQKRRLAVSIKGIGVLIILYLVTVYQFDMTAGKAVQIFEIIAFVLLFVYMGLVYIPFSVSAFRLAKKIDEPVFQRGIKSLGWMAICFILIFLNFLLDRVMLIAFAWAYSVFYFAAWLFVIAGAGTAYLGYIKPKVKDMTEETN